MIRTLPPGLGVMQCCTIADNLQGFNSSRSTAFSQSLSLFPNTSSTLRQRSTALKLHLSRSCLGLRGSRPSFRSFLSYDLEKPCSAVCLNAIQITCRCHIMVECSIGTWLPQFPAESACRMVAGSLDFNHRHGIVPDELWGAVVSALYSKPSMFCTLHGLRTSCSRGVLPTALAASHIVMLFAHPQSLSSPEVMSRILFVPAKSTACARRIKSRFAIFGNRPRYSHSVKLAHVEVFCRFQGLPCLLLQDTNALHASSVQTPHTFQF